MIKMKKIFPLLLLFLLSFKIVCAINVSDQEIAQAVDRQLMLHPAVSANMIDVTSKDGIVTLKGSVYSIAEERKAVQIAESLVGVRGVINKLEVITPEFPDEALQKHVEEALKRHPVTSNYSINVKSQNGNVELTGSVPGNHAKKISQMVAENVLGVKKIDNKLQAKTSEKKSDQQIKDDITRRLRNSAMVDDGLINVTVKNGFVTLQGSVASAIEKTEAIETALVEGVSNVEAKNLKVDVFARNGEMRAGKYEPKTDEELRKALEDALSFDARLVDNIPQVRVKEGIVTLFGTVDNYNSKIAAESTAGNVVGVVSVRNMIKVRPRTPIQDTDLETRVRQAIEHDPHLNKSDIAVNILNGTVILSGTVGNSYYIYRAEDVVAGVAGVTAIENQIEFKNGSARAASQRDFQIEQSITESFEWSTQINHDSIQVRVSNGNATLHGKVETWHEKLTAEQLAYDAGAIMVWNNIEVSHSNRMSLNRRD
jgi:osmotically-inducible protein OsmY